MALATLTIMMARGRWQSEDPIGEAGGVELVWLRGQWTYWGS